MYDDMQPDNTNPAPIGAHDGSVDREGAMAKADLHKLANYSIKLFKKIQDDDQLEGWVQAKITKAADYIASVYHYLEYEMEFSEYGAKLDNSEMYNEGQKLELKNKLMEAKAKVAELKKLQAEKKTKEEKVKEAFDDKAKVGDTKKTPTGELTKTATGVIHRNTSYADDGDAEDKSGKGKKSHAKAQSAAEKKDRAPAQKQSPKSAKTWGMKDGVKFDNRDKVAEATKSDKADKDYDGDGEVESGKDEYLGSKIRAAKKAGKLKEGTCSVCHKDPCKCKEAKCNECGMYESKCECSTNESAKPSAGMTKKEKSSTVKAAKAGKDIGKPGKSFDKVAKAAGGGEKGEKIAAAAMWKNKAKSLKESLDAMSEASDQGDVMVNALIQRAQESDPEGLQSAMQQGPEALTSFLKQFMQEIENKFDSGEQPTDTAGTEPKDIPDSGDVAAEEDIVSAIGSQLGRNAANAAGSAGDQQSSTNIAMMNDPKMKQAFQQFQAKQRMASGGVADTEVQPDINTGWGAKGLPTPIRESTEFDRMKQFLTRLNG